VPTKTRPVRESRDTAGLTTPSERRVLFAVLLVLFVALCAFTFVSYSKESSFYENILDQASKGGVCRENVMLFQVALAPFRSLSMVRTAALFLSFVLVLLGSLFVLTGIEAAYKLSLDLGEKKGALETASPGLVLVTAGALLVAASLYRSGSPVFSPIPHCGRAAEDPGQNDRQALDALNPQRGKPQ
jgi:tellurite resistance protein TehA-like permease